MWSLGHNKYPRIYIGNRKCKDLLLNFLSYEEITEPIMRGQDHWGRKFLVIKYIINYLVYVDIYLQFTTLWENRWIVCGQITPTLFPYKSILTDQQMGFIESIMLGQNIKLKSSHKPYNKAFEKYTIKLYNN